MQTILHKAPARTVRRTSEGLFLGTVSTAITLIDVVFSLAFWLPRGAHASAILQAPARWVWGAAVPDSWLGELLGCGVLFSLYLAATLVLRWFLHTWPALLKRALYTGICYGFIAYAIIFQVLVPALAAPLVPNHSSGWILGCSIFHSLLIGPAMMWAFSQRQSA